MKWRCNNGSIILTFNWSIYQNNDVFRCGLRSFVFVIPFSVSSLHFSVSKCTCLMRSLHTFVLLEFHKRTFTGDLCVWAVTTGRLCACESECRVESSFQFSLIGYFCRCWLISLTSVVNWNIISIVFLCSMKLCACAACFGHCSALHLHWFFTRCVDENQYISIKKENWCSNQMQEEKSWSRKNTHRRGLTLCKRPTWLCDLRFYMRRMWMIDSGIVFEPPKLHATLLPIIHQVLSSRNIQPKDEKHCFRWWIVLLVPFSVFVFRKRFYFFTFWCAI